MLCFVTSFGNGVLCYQKHKSGNGTRNENGRYMTFLVSYYSRIALYMQRFRFLLGTLILVSGNKVGVYEVFIIVAPSL